MITDLQWKYAKMQRDMEEARNPRWYDPREFHPDANSHMVLAFEDMENRQFEQDCYDEFENPRCSYKESFEAHQHHHELAEPVPQHQLDVERIIELLEA